MGCDIHLHFERKNEKGQGWHKIEIPEELIPRDRDYLVFSFLAGVRGGEGNFSQRGIPQDSCIEKEFVKLMDHSHTHAYLDEILQAAWENTSLDKCYFYIFCLYVLPRMLSHTGYLSQQEKRDIRVIMGFDN